MKALTNIIRKEIKEMLTKSTILPIIVLAVLFGYLGNMMSGVQEEATSESIIGMVDLDDGVLSDITMDVLSRGAKIVYNGTDIDEGLAVAKEEGATALLVIPSNFTENISNETAGTIQIFWIMKGAGLLDSISSISVQNLISSVELGISAYMIETGSSSDPSLVLDPTTTTDTTLFKDKEMDGISPSTLDAIISSQSLTVPLIIMMIIMMAGGTVISSMGMEKESKTLETLLTLPVKRSSIVTGKLVASAIIGLLMAGIYMLGFNYYMTSFSAGVDIDLAEYGLALNTLDYVLIGVSLFVSLLAALSLCMVLGTFTRDYKSAQTLTGPVAILAMIPMFITMFKDYNTLPLAAQVLLFAIPFTHPMMAMRSLMFDDYILVISGIVYVTIFAVVMIAIAVWIFRTDRLLTGSRKMDIRKFPIIRLLKR
ncbi:MAG: ABC transporter permease [Thermoplasmata archaeon]|nr:ABC transporter permease [Thermoplasmata archaeon]